MTMTVQKPSLFNQVEGVDWLLVQLINYAEIGINVGVTLHVRGTLIVGELISSSQYFDLLAARFKSANWGGPRTENASPAALGEAIEGLKQALPLLESEGQRHPHFFHLRGARICAPGQPAMPEWPDMLWRGRLADVSGFTPQDISA